MNHPNPNPSLADRLVKLAAEIDAQNAMLRLDAQTGNSAEAISARLSAIEQYAYAAQNIFGALPPDAFVGGLSPSERIARGA